MPENLEYLIVQMAKDMTEDVLDEATEAELAALIRTYGSLKDAYERDPRFRAILVRIAKRHGLHLREASPTQTH